MAGGAIGVTDVEVTITIRDTDGCTDIDGNPLSAEDIAEWFDNLDAESLGVEGADVETECSLSLTESEVERSDTDA